VEQCRRSVVRMRIVRRFAAATQVFAGSFAAVVWRGADSMGRDCPASPALSLPNGAHMSSHINTNMKAVQQTQAYYLCPDATSTGLLSRPRRIPDPIWLQQAPRFLPNVAFLPTHLTTTSTTAAKVCICH
jgi:hypothetical protein